MFVRTNVLVALCCLTLGTPIAAQETSTPVVSALGDSASWSVGRAEGRASADEALVAHRAFIGFVVGVPMGFWILPAAFSANRVLLVGEGVGVAAVVGVGRVGSPNPPAVLAEQAAARGPEFERG